MKRVVIGALIFVVYLACVVAAAFALHFWGSKFVFFCIVLGLLGGGTIAFAVWYMSRMDGESAHSGGSDSINLDALLRDANRKLRTSRLGIKSMAAAQIIYVVGEDNSAKTQTVLQSGLDAELLAGNLFRDGVVAPTQLANIWLAGSSVIVEAGGALLRQPALWQRLIKGTRPGKLSSVFSRNSKLPPRVVVVCVSSERVPGPSEAGYNGDQIRASAQALNERLRQLSQTLGISVPIYVLFTKLDTLTHFADYAGRLSAEEVNGPLGSLLPQVEAGSGLFAERASKLVSSRLDELIYTLSEFRLEVLSRGGELKMLASAYEFPRDLQKRRGAIVDFLVELTRPSQLGINPFLRGLFFSGMRAVVVEEAVAAPAQPQASMPIDAGATRVFSIGGVEQQPSQQPVRISSRKVPQWAFLPHLFSKLLLADKSALEASRASTKVNILKRALLAGLCCCIFAYLALLTISFFNNLDLENQEAADAAFDAKWPAANQFPSVQSLQALDHLGTLLRKLDSYRKDGPSLVDGWGLYRGDALYKSACSAYSIKFDQLLLGPTQSNILAQLGALQSSPPVGADYTTTAYNPLKAYLITTSNPDRSTTDFLQPALLAAWRTTGTPSPDLDRLAQTQFQTYAHFRSDPQSCLSAPSTIGPSGRDAVANARVYLNAFDVYKSMLATANRTFQSIRFSDKFPGSVDYIKDNYEVKGAFTKNGFAVMQDNIQHLDKYFEGEKWVLGPQAGSVDTNSTQLMTGYIAGYIEAWRSYLTAARFVVFRNWKDADSRLNILDSPSSPILQLFSLISINTSVDQRIINAFQAPQLVVPSNSPPDRPSNDTYISALLSMAGAVKSMADNTQTQNAPTAALQVQQAADQADLVVVTNFRNKFIPPDSTSFTILEAPIKSVHDLASAAPAAAAGEEAKLFCDQAGDVLNNFPFNPLSKVDAPPDQVTQIFAPGKIFDQYTANLSQFIVLEGGKYRQNPASAYAINKKFLTFLSAAKQVQSALFPPGVTQPTLNFNLTEVKTPGVPDAILNIDGTQINAAGQTAKFPWVAQPSSRVTIKTPENSAIKPPSSWSIFHLILPAPHPSPNRFEYKFQGNGQTDQIIQFDINPAGAELLNPSFMNQLMCVTKVGK